LSPDFHFSQSLCSGRLHVTKNSIVYSMSKSHCDWQSVSRSVLVSYPIWGIWPETCLLI
jgi:hypothetical protein